MHKGTLILTFSHGEKELPLGNFWSIGPPLVGESKTPSPLGEG
jgi:hypothetical protein